MKKANKDTIKIIIIALLCALGDNLFGQAFLGGSIGLKSYEYQTGWVVGKTQISASYSVPFDANDKPKIAAFKIGYLIPITDWDKGNYYIVTSFGYGYLKWEDFKSYNNDLSGKKGFDAKDDWQPTGSVEFRRERDAGHIFGYVSYCKEFYCGVGFRVYPSAIINR